MISTQMLSSRWAFSASTYSGPIAATIGSILVEMKKNRPSRHRGTGCTDRAYAAGTPSTSTRTVETVVAISEWVTYGPQPENTSRNCASVGLKTNLGGQVWAPDSGLNAVITINSTGRKNETPTTHAKPPQPTCPDIRRSRSPAGSWSRIGTAVMVCSRAGLQTKARSCSCLLELEDPGEHPQRERGHDDREDDGDHPGGSRPPDVERVVHLLVQVVGQVGGRGPRAALGHGLHRVEHVDQVDRAEQDAQLDVGPQMREGELAERGEGPGAVNLGRFQRVRRLALQAGQHDQRHERGPLPDHDHDHRAECVRGQPGHVMDAERLKQVVQQPELRVQH